VRSFPVALVLAVAGLAAGVGASHGASAAGPALVAAPREVGAPVVGQRLTAEHGTWNSSAAIAYHYQWYRCDAGASHCGSIHGATAPSYRLVAADTAHTIGLTVTATDSSGAASAYASVIGPVSSASTAFVSTVQPAAAGAVKLGQTVQVDSGAWSRTPASLGYTWLRCNQNGRICASIAGATAAAYTVTADDVGHALVALVTASFSNSKVTALSSAATAAAPPPATTTTTTSSTGGPSNTAPPSVTGSAAQGAQLVATPGTWSGGGGQINYAYQWYRCDATGAHCSSIHGATAATHKLVAADVTHTLGLTVTATQGTGKTSAYASLVGPIAAPGALLVSTVQPTITGTATSGKTLTVSAGTWTAPPASTTFAWERCNANGRICVPVAGATSASFTVTADDRGHQVLAVVTASSGSNSAPALSKAVPVA
jgi:hypothetical protein